MLNQSIIFVVTMSFFITTENAGQTPKAAECLSTQRNDIGSCVSNLCCADREGLGNFCTIRFNWRYFGECCKGSECKHTGNSIKKTTHKKERLSLKLSMHSNREIMRKEESLQKGWKHPFFEIQGASNAMKILGALQMLNQMRESVDETIQCVKEWKTE